MNKRHDCDKTTTLPTQIQTQRQRFKKWPLALLCICATVSLAPTLAANNTTTATRNNPVAQSKTLLEANNAKAQATQRSIDTLDAQTKALAQEYEKTLRALTATNQQNDRLQAMINDQAEKLANLEQQLSNIDNTQQSLRPLLENMLQALAQFVKLDVPFHRADRLAHIETLQDSLTMPGKSLSDHYREILKTYAKEVDYGHTIETYQTMVDPTTVGKKQSAPLQVDALRIGRVALIYKTADDQHLAAWHKDTQGWVPIGKQYLSPVRRAMAVARKQTAPELVVAPFAAPHKMATQPHQTVSQPHAGDQ